MNVNFYKNWQLYSRRKLIVKKPTSTGNEVMIIPRTRDQAQVGALARWSDLGRS